ncbi:MAG: hypothetical protein AAB888_00305 [Patescibacteria group bacterium]
MNNKPKNKKSGYSLVEAVVYVTALAFISVVAINSIMLFQNLFLEMKKNRNVGNAAEIAMGRMMREIKNATDISGGGSAFDSNPGRLTVTSLDNLGTAVSIEFYVENNILKIKENAVAKGSLMPENTLLNSLIFRQISGVRSKGVKIEMTLKDSRGKSPLIKNFYGTAVLRGSY